MCRVLSHLLFLLWWTHHSSHYTQQWSLHHCFVYLHVCCSSKGGWCSSTSSRIALACTGVFCFETLHLKVCCSVYMLYTSQSLQYILLHISLGEKDLRVRNEAAVSTRGGVGEVLDAKKSKVKHSVVFINAPSW